MTDIMWKYDDGIDWANMPAYPSHGNIMAAAISAGWSAVAADAFATETLAQLESEWSAQSEDECRAERRNEESLAGMDRYDQCHIENMEDLRLHESLFPNGYGV